MSQGLLPKTRSSGDDQTWDRAEQGGLLELQDLDALHDGPVRHESSSKPTHAGIIHRILFLIARFICYPAPGSLRLRRTSWLDGVRGVAALSVYLFHAMGLWAPIVPAWHADKDQTNIMQLPIIRTIFVAGGGAVSVFFVLSGYVLTYRCLRLIRSGSAREVYSAVGSSMFRRGFRLYLPPTLLTFTEMLATRIGYPPPLNFNFKPEPTFFGQVWDWLVETNKLINPLHNFSRSIRGLVTHPKYDPVIWTIPVEFYGSIICYLLLFALARVSNTRLRMGSVALLLCIPSMFFGCWNIFCFTSGMLLADFTLGQEHDESITAVSTSSFPSTKTTKKHRILYPILLTISLYLAGFPALIYPESRTSPMPGFETLRSLIPSACFTKMEDPARFWWSLSGILLLLSISQLPRVKSIFETRACQYLAKISFALYLVHEFCIVLFGGKLKGWLEAGTGLGPEGKEVVHSVGYWVLCGGWFGVFSVLVFAVAAQVERWVDQPSVRFAKAVEERAKGCLGRLK